MSRIVKILIPFLTGLLVCSCDPKADSYTVVVSLDAFRWDYPDIADTPGLNEIASNGIRCILKPSYPASTFPNHYTIATGLVPDHHGIINGSFWNPDTKRLFSMGDSLTRYDPEYYYGEPIWVTAEKAGVKTASIYWVGSDVATQGVLPTYAYPWWDTPHLSFEERANEAVRLLSLPKDARPKLLMLYFDEPDATSHKYGPLAQETKEMVKHLDSIIVNMYHRLQALPHGNKINLIVLADHGMTEVNNDRLINWGDYIKPSWYEHIVGTNPTNIYAKANCMDSIMTALANVDHINVWKHGEVPENLNYGTSDRCGDIIIAPDLGWQFAPSRKDILGAHGYSPEEKDMQAIFVACGPYFKNKTALRNSSFSNVDIYPLLADILSIASVPTDGKLPLSH